MKNIMTFQTNVVRILKSTKQKVDVEISVKQHRTESQRKTGPGKIDQGLKRLIVLPQDLDSIPSIHIVAHTSK